ncbi:WXG100 family type VII secretion target [Actinophytocola gossypii]|uniref:WXG100 family type VII secretion target n=1 Tax=Actinophytocola gossypii TaxID=2812003 RepID=A0ABT2JFS1_9PSEU|nr:WXG100 family type VII secretion target [Actinophytocola gossypii]MCT2586708.1 WXG100 family type VII secretion target [Actinophytocola gossypii]
MTPRRPRGGSDGGRPSDTPSNHGDDGSPPTTGGSGGDGVHVDPDSIDGMAGRLGNTGGRVDSVGSTLDGINVGPQSMGIVGSTFTGAAQQHVRNAREQVTRTREAVRNAQDGTRQTAQTYRDTDAANASDLSSIDTDPGTPTPPTGSTTPSGTDQGGSTSPSGTSPPPQTSTPPGDSPGGDQPGGGQPVSPPPSRPTGPHAPLTPEQQADLGRQRTELEQNNQQRFDELKRDPDHNNKVNKNSMEEARTALDLERRGEEGFGDGGYRRPDGPGQGEFIDSNGRHWDIKGIHSDWPPGVPEQVRNSRPFPNAYSEQDFRDTLTDQFGKGRGVIVDTRNADQAAIDNMREVVEREGWGDNVIWYP